MFCNDLECSGEYLNARNVPDVSWNAPNFPTRNFQGESRSDLSSKHMMMNGSSGFVSGGCSTNSSVESLHYKPFTNS